jgi:hypothetical protein
MNWKKLETIEDCGYLKKGDELVKYPVDGEPVNNLNLSDTGNLRYGRIAAIEPDVVTVKLLIGKDVDTSDDALFEGEAPIQFQQILREQKWWCKPQ